MTAATYTWKRPSVLPGFGLTLGYSLVYLSIIVLLPLAALLVRPHELGIEGFWKTITAPRVIASLKLSFGASAIAALVNCVFGLIVPWVLARYRFPFKRLVDALVDLPFALPTAVAGIALATLYSQSGWVGGLLWALGTALKFVPVVLLPFIRREAWLYGFAFLAVLAVITLATWPQTLRQLDIVLNYPRPLRIDYLLLAWGVVPWLWSRPWPPRLSREWLAGR